MIAVLRREWVAAWREKRGFAMRALYGIGLLACGILLWLMQWAESALTTGRLAEFGWTFFAQLSVAQYLLASFLGAVVLARTIVKEKESGALELLVLSRLSGFEILLGKTLAELAQLAFVLVAGVPVLCYLLVLGGVTLDEIVATHLIVLGQLMFVAAVAVMFSAFFDSFHQVMLMTAAVAGGLVLVTEVRGTPPWLAPFWPSAALRAELAMPGGGPTEALWTFAAGALCVIAAAGAASLFLERQVQRSWVRRTPGRGLVRAWQRLMDAVSPKRRWTVGGSNPLMRRETVLGGGFRIAWIAWVALYVIGVVGAWAWVGAEAANATVCVIALCGAVLAVGLSAALSVVSERRSGAIEVLLSAGVEPREIVEAKLLKCAVQAALLLAPPVVHALLIGGVWQGHMKMEYPAGGMIEIALRAAAAAVTGSAICIMGGVLMSVRSKTPAGAVVGAVIIAPFVILGQALFWSLPLLWALVWTASLIPEMVSFYVLALKSFRKHALSR